MYTYISICICYVCVCVVYVVFAFWILQLLEYIVASPRVACTFGVFVLKTSSQIFSDAYLVIFLAWSSSSGKTASLSLQPAIGGYVFLATCGALLCCAQLVCICLQDSGSQQCIQESDISWRREKLHHCAHTSLYNVHLSYASQAPRWAPAHTAKLLLCSSSPANVNPLMSHALCVSPYGIILLFGAFLPLLRTVLGCLLLHWLPAVLFQSTKGQPALGAQRGSAGVFPADTYVCASTRAGLKTPAFICRLTNRISAKLGTSSIYIFRVCVHMSFLHCLILFYWQRIWGWFISETLFSFSLFQAFLFKVSSRHNGACKTSNCKSRREELVVYVRGKDLDIVVCVLISRGLGTQ